MIKCCFNEPVGQKMESKQYRVKAVFFDELKDKSFDIKYSLREEVTESDIINALLHKHLKEINEKDVLNYFKNVLKKDV